MKSIPIFNMWKKTLPKSLSSTVDNSKLLPIDESTNVRYHKHTIITVKVKNPIKDPVYCIEWFNKLIDKIDMKILVPPQAIYCDKEGNRGLTCIAIIETSHISLHSWDECTPGLMELDVFSCKDYDINDVIEMLSEFGIEKIDYRCVDRTNNIQDIKMYAVYKVTNKVNGKFYIGVHGDYTSSNFSNKHKYFGSGNGIKNAIKKHGKENFNYEIIKLFHNEKDAYEEEKRLITPELISSGKVYNMSTGGNHVSYTDAIRDKISNKLKGKKSNKWITKIDNTESIFILEEDAIRLVDSGEYKYGRVMSKESKNKMSQNRKGRPSHKKGKKMPNIVKDKITQSILLKFKNGYKVWNDGAGWYNNGVENKIFKHGTQPPLWKKGKL